MSVEAGHRQKHGTRHISHSSSYRSAPPLLEFHLRNLLLHASRACYSVRCSLKERPDATSINATDARPRTSESAMTAAMSSQCSAAPDDGGGDSTPAFTREAHSQPLSQPEQAKVQKILAACRDEDHEALTELAASRGGLVDDNVRRTACTQPYRSVAVQVCLPHSQGLYYWAAGTHRSIATCRGEHSNAIETKSKWRSMSIARSCIILSVSLPILPFTDYR